MSIHELINWRSLYAHNYQQNLLAEFLRIGHINNFTNNIDISHPRRDVRYRTIYWKTYRLPLIKSGKYHSQYPKKKDL